MKTTKFLALALATTLVISCSKDQVDSVEEANLSKSIDSYELSGVFASGNKSLSAKDYKGQAPQAKYDNSEKGLYRGLVAAKEGMSRGYLNLNVGNDGNYIASLEMADGVQFKLVANANNLNAVYHFSGAEGSLKVDLSDFNNVIVSDVVLNNQEYFSQVFKHTTTRMPAARTGTWLQTSNPAFNGTWNIIADGTIVSPNGFGGEGITSVLITRGGAIFTDTTMEPWDFTPCGAPTSTWVPTIGFVGGITSPNAITTWAQTTNIGSNPATWNMIADFQDPYADNACTPMASGTWAWNGRTGEIYTDIVP